MYHNKTKRKKVPFELSGWIEEKAEHEMEGERLGARSRYRDNTEL